MYIRRYPDGIETEGAIETRFSFPKFIYSMKEENACITN